MRTRVVSRSRWFVLALAAAPLGCKKDAPAPSPAPAAPVASSTSPAAAPVDTADVGPAPAPKAPPAPPVAAAPEVQDVGAPAPVEADTSAPAVAVPPVLSALPGATLTRRTGPVAAKSIQPLSVAASSVWSDERATFVTFTLPAEGTLGDLADFEARVVGDRFGVLVRDGAFDSRQYIVRLAGGATSPDLVVLEVAGGSPRYSSGQTLPWDKQSITVTGLGKAQKARELPKRFFHGLSARFAGRAFGRPFYAFAEGRAAMIAEGGKLPPAFFENRPPRSDVAEMMSLYSGVKSMEEAVQSDRGLRLRGESGNKRTIPITDVAAVPLPPHDWKALIGEKVAVVEPLAAAIPADTLYLHFHDLRSAVYLGRQLDEWLTPILPILDSRPGPSHLVERYQSQLVLERTALSEALGNLVSDGVALVVGDPFVREGTDVSVVFNVKERAILLTQLSTFEARARVKRPDLAETTYEVSGRTVRRIATADRAMDQHRLELGDLLIVSNSKAAIERFVAVADKKTASLAESGDYRYMRLQFPFDKAAEDGFFFMSDAFVGRAVSPSTRILESRRVAAGADLQTIAHAQLLYSVLEGKPATSLDDLFGLGLLDKSELVHGEGGPITHDLGKGATSAAWGSTRFLTPLAELTIASVSDAEKAAYDRFRETYQSYWRSFVDPAGVRLKVDAATGKIAFDTKIMPLIDGTDYSRLREWAGKAQFTPASTGDVIQWSFGVGDDSPLRREMNGLTEFVGSKTPMFDWLGTYCFVGFQAAGSLSDAVISMNEVPQAGPRDESRKDDWVSVIDALPLYAGVEVKNPLSLAASLTAIRAFVERAAPGIIAWNDGGAHRDVPFTKVVAQLGNFVPSKQTSMDAYYAIAKNVFLVALDRGVLERQVDAVLDGTAIAPVADGATGVQADVHFAPGATTGLRDAILLLLEGASVQQWLAAHQDAELLRLAFSTYPDGDAGRERALAFLGYEPVVLQGGELLPRDGGLTSTLYGTPAEPTLPATPIAGSPVAKLIDALTSLDLAVSFEGEGATAALHVTGAWVRKLD